MANTKEVKPKKLSSVTLTQTEAKIFADFKGHYKILDKPMGRRLKRIIEAADFMSKHYLGQFQWASGSAVTKAFTYVPNINGLKLVSALKAKKVKIEEPPKKSKPKDKGKQTGLVTPPATVPTPVSAE